MAATYSNISIEIGAEINTDGIKNQIQDLNKNNPIKIPVDVNLNVPTDAIDNLRKRLQNVTSEIDFTKAFSSFEQNLNGLTTQVQKISTQMETVLTASIRESFDKALLNGFFDKVDLSTLENNLQRIMSKSKELGGTILTPDGTSVEQWTQVEAALNKIKPILAYDVELLQKFFLVMMNAPDNNAMLNAVNDLQAIADKGIIAVATIEGLGETITVTDGVVSTMANDVQASANAMASVETTASGVANAIENTATAFNSFKANADAVASAENTLASGAETTATGFNSVKEQAITVESAIEKLRQVWVKFFTIEDLDVADNMYEFERLLPRITNELSKSNSLVVDLYNNVERIGSLDVLRAVTTKLSQASSGLIEFKSVEDEVNTQYVETIRLSVLNAESKQKEYQIIRTLTNAFLKMRGASQSISSINKKNGGLDFSQLSTDAQKFYTYFIQNTTQAEQELIGLTGGLENFKAILAGLINGYGNLFGYEDALGLGRIDINVPAIKTFLAGQKQAIADAQQLDNEVVKLENALKRAFNIDTSGGNFTVTLDQLKSVVAEAPLAQQYIDEIESRFQTLGQTSQTATAEMTSGMQTANTSLAEYAQYSGQLVSNTESVANAEKYLATSMEQVATAEQQVSTAMQTATQSEQSATQAVGTMDSQLGDFQNRLNTVSNALTAFSEGIQNLTQLNEVFGRFDSSITSFNTAITRLETAISGIGTAIESGFGGGNASLTTFNNNLSNVVTTVENMASSTIAFTRDMTNGLANINPNSINLTPVTNQLTEICNQIKSIITFVDESIPVINSNTGGFIEILNSINSNISAVNSNLVSLSESMSTAFTGVIGEINQVATAIGGLNQAETQAENNAQAFSGTVSGMVDAIRNAQQQSNGFTNSVNNQTNAFNETAQAAREAEEVFAGVVLEEENVGEQSRNATNNINEETESLKRLRTELDGVQADENAFKGFNVLSQLDNVKTIVSQAKMFQGQLVATRQTITGMKGDLQVTAHLFRDIVNITNEQGIVIAQNLTEWQEANGYTIVDNFERLNQQEIRAANNADKLKQKLDTLNSTFTDASSKKPLKELSHIQALDEAYQKVLYAVNTYRTANTETMESAKTQAEIALARFEALGKQYQNLEYLATELRTKDFGEVRTQWGEKLIGFITDLINAQSKAESLGLTIQGLNVDIQGLVNEFTNISNTSDTGSNQLKAFLTTFSNAQVQFQQGTKELQIYEQNQSKLSTTLKSSESAMRSLTTAQNTLNKMGTDTNVSQTKVTVGELITELTTLQNEIRSIGVNDTGGITSVSQRMNELKARIDALSTSVRSLKSNFSQTQDMEKFESKLEILKNKVAYFSKMNNKDPSFNAKIRELTEQLNSLEKGDTAGLTRLTNQFRVLQSQMKATGSLGLSIFGKLKQQIGMFTMYFSAFTVVMRTISTVKEAITTINELDTALVDLKKTFQGTQEEMEQFYYTSNKVAKELGVTTQSVIEQASAWSRLGFSTAEAAESMSKLSSQFTVISPGMTTDEATDALVSVMKAFDYAPNEVLSEVMDKINIIGNTASTSNKEIANMLQKSSSAMKEANNTLEETIALETAAVEITRDSDSVGNAFKTISMR